jgi:hypothetical protein
VYSAAHGAGRAAKKAAPREDPPRITNLRSRTDTGLGRVHGDLYNVIVRAKEIITTVISRTAHCLHAN